MTTDLRIVELSVDAREHGERESGRLAGARLRLSDDVLRRIAEQSGQRRLLDFGGLGEAHVVEALEQLVAQIEILEAFHRVQRRVGILALDLDRVRLHFLESRAQQLLEQRRVRCGCLCSY